MAELSMWEFWVGLEEGKMYFCCPYQVGPNGSVDAACDYDVELTNERTLTELHTIAREHFADKHTRRD